MSDSQAITELLNADFFKLLGVPKRFEQDLTVLDERFRQLQMQVHPDRFVAADDASRRASMMLATHINEAYQVLRTPLKRATYLLSLASVDVGAESNTAMPPDFLMNQMIWREQVSEARSEKNLPALEVLESEISDAIRVAYATLSNDLDSLVDTKSAVDDVRRLMFMEKLHEEIKNAIFDLEDR